MCGDEAHPGRLTPRSRATLTVAGATVSEHTRRVHGTARLVSSIALLAWVGYRCGSGVDGSRRAQQAAQSARAALTADDYARAERFMGYNTTPLVFRHGAAELAAARELAVRASRGRSLLVSRHGAGRRRVRAGRSGARRPTSPPSITRKLAAALSSAAGERYTALTLPFNEFDSRPTTQSIEFAAAKRRWRCDRQGATARRSAPRPMRRAAGPGPPGAGTHTCRRPTARGRRSSATTTCGCATSSGRETQLTTDGIKDFAYATNDAGWTRSDTPVVVWSPDSKQIATFRHDSRGVGEMYLRQHRRRPSDADRRSSIRCRATTRSS